jgi:hypothetical protein
MVDDGRSSYHLADILFLLPITEGIGVSAGGVPVRLAEARRGVPSAGAGAVHVVGVGAKLRIQPILIGPRY